MNCNCINDIENKLVGREYGDKKKKITKAKIIDIAFMFNPGSVDMCSNSRLELTVEGYKKVQHQSLVHSYCPFCGEKITKKIVEH